MIGQQMLSAARRNFATSIRLARPSPTGRLIYFSFAADGLDLDEHRAGKTATRTEIERRQARNTIGALFHCNDGSTGIPVQQTESFLMRWFKSILGPSPNPNANAAYNKAINASDELIRKMNESSNSTDAVRAMMADIWAQRHNMPFLVTVYEATQEMNAAVERGVDNEKPS